MSDFLIPEKELVGCDQIVEGIVSRDRSVHWEKLDPSSRQAYGRYALFSDEHARREANFSRLPAEQVFYNKYYWILIFSKRYQSKFGKDAGIEQQAFKVLETAPPNVDWKTVEEIVLAVGRI